MAENAYCGPLKSKKKLNYLNRLSRVKLRFKYDQNRKNRKLRRRRERIGSCEGGEKESKFAICEGGEKESEVAICEGGERIGRSAKRREILGLQYLI
nr:hypothetical protein Iba_chr15aCG2480 [Ipomoea batatas]